ncbi:MAG: SpoIVB peptidase [Bacillota bacterium]
MKRNTGKLFIVIAAMLLFLMIAMPLNVRSKLKNDIRLFEGQEHLLQLQLPLDLYIRADKPGIIGINGSPARGGQYNRLSLRNDLSLTGLASGSVNLEFSLFNGLIPIRQLTVSVLPEKEVIVGGHSIGIKLHENGVIVAGYFYLKRGEDLFSPAEEAGIKIGDLIISLNDYVLKDIERAASIIKREASRGPLKLTVKRKSETFNVTISPFLCQESEEYRIGLYIRDTAAGVGTLTFYDPLSQCYGALGHVITDLDSNIPLEINEGVIVQADVINIKMAQRGQPGEKAGIFREGDKILGTIEKNTQSGIYGKIDNLGYYVTPYTEPLPVALAFQVENGPAEMLTVLEGNKIQSFMVQIERTNNQNKPGDKGIIFRIVDEQLLEITGGIVQGMSGSPIIQNGRIVGAVTHVFVNDPARGYAIYAEWMLNESGIYPLY